MPQWKLTSKKPLQEAANGTPETAIVVDLDALCTLQALEGGQSFEMGISTDGGHTFQREKTCLVGDGQSLLWGSQIVPLPASATPLRKPGQFRLATGPYAQRMHVYMENPRSVKPKERTGAGAGGAVKAPMTGKLLSVLVEEGQSVEEGTALLTIEAMKMENRILADGAGVVRNIKAQPGSMATLGDVLLTIEPAKK